MAGRPANYAIDPSQEEHERLAWVAAEHGVYVREACRRAGLRSGGVAIDVGCGPLGALADLAEVVGPGGVVVGLDASAAALQTADALLQERAIGNVQFVQGDIHAISAAALCPPGPFDLAFCRLFLFHQTDPAATLRRIAALVRPGGGIVAHEALDEVSLTGVEPPLPAYDRVWELVIAAMRHRGARTDAARRYEELCAAAGLSLVSQRGHFVLHKPQRALAMRRAGLFSIRRTLLDGGLCAAQEVEALAGALQDADPTIIRWLSSPLMVELLARVPDPAA